MENNDFPVCPDCSSPFRVDLKGLEVGDILECTHCGTEVELLSKTPYRIEIIEEEK